MELPVFKVIEGKRDILLSAPHVFPHSRPTLKSSLKQGEEYTDEIVKGVCLKTGAWGIYLCTNSPDFDPNYHRIERNPYKQKIFGLIKEGKVSKVIDIHGLSDFHNFDLGFYYCIRYLRSKNMANQIIDSLAKYPELKGLAYHIWYDTKFDPWNAQDSLQETITKFVCGMNKYPAIQLEIAYYIRKDPVLRQAIIEGISQFVLSL